jgi:hypothetical protein
MEFETFAFSRDFLYLFAVLVGAAVGCLLHYFRKNNARRPRNRALTLAFCLFAGAVIALALSIVRSNGAVFREIALYPAAFLILALFVLAFRFPRTAGFPLVLLLGSLTVWIGLSCLRFSRITDAGRSMAVIINDGNGRFVVRMMTIDRQEETSFAFKAEGEDFLDFTLEYISFTPAFPIAGGQTRGLVTAISCSGENFFEASGLAGIDLAAKFPGISRLNSSGQISLSDIPPGAKFSLYFDGKTLSFEPQGARKAAVSLW